MSTAESALDALDPKGKAGEEDDNVSPIRTRASDQGARKAAIALMMLGNDIAQELLRVMADDEVRRLLRVSGNIQTIEPEEALEVLEEFVGYFDGANLLLPRTDRFVLNLAEETFGKEKVRRLLGEPEPEPVPEPEPEVDEEPDHVRAEAMKAGPEALGKVLAKEHPQTMAVALAVMPTEMSAAVLVYLPEDVRPDVVRRVALLKSVTPSLIRDIGDTLRRELDASVGDAMTIDGQETVVSLLKALNQEEEDLIFEGLAETNPTLSEEIRKRMFVFEDFMGLDPRALQMMLKEIDGRTLTLGLKTATTALRQHMLSAMSSRAATMILEDLEAMGPVSVTQVEASQDEIVQVALRLASEGKISLR